MDFDAAGQFATIVGLIADFLAHRADRKGAQLSDFVEWLRRSGHDQVIEAIEANHQTSIGIKAILVSGQRELEGQLREIDQKLAVICRSSQAFTALSQAYYPAVPTDILSHLGPESPRERVRQFLGTPHRVSGENFWAYRFPELLVQVDFYDGGGAKSIAIALTWDSPEEGFVLPPGGQLGKMTLAEAMTATGDLQYTTNHRGVQNIQYNERIGPIGAWRNFAYGVLDPVATGALAGREFQWDAEKGALQTDPSTLLLNWFGTSASSAEEQFFDWTIGLPF